MRCKPFAIFITALATQATWACGESPLRQIAQDLSGPTVVPIATITIIAMVVSAMEIGWGDGLERTKMLALLVLAMSIAVGACSFLLTVFSVGAGVV